MTTMLEKEALLHRSATAAHARRCGARVILVGGPPLLLAGVRRLLADASFDVVAHARDADEVLRRVAGHRPDVVVVLALGADGDGGTLRALSALRADLPQLSVLLLARDAIETVARTLLAERGGGIGYILEHRIERVDALTDVLRQVLAGGTILDPEVVACLVGSDCGDPLRILTAREREVLAFVAAGRSNLGVARQLVVTQGAIEKHMRNIFAKLSLSADSSVHRRVIATRVFLRAYSGSIHGPLRA